MTIESATRDRNGLWMHELARAIDVVAQDERKRTVGRRPESGGCRNMQILGMHNTTTLGWLGVTGYVLFSILFANYDVFLLHF